MANQPIDVDQPSSDSSPPTTPQAITPQESHILTPLTWPLHPSAIQAITSSFNLNTGSPNFISPTFPATVIQPSPLASINPMSSLGQNINTPVSETKSKSSRRSTKGGKGKAQSSSTRQATTSKIPKYKPTDTSKKRKAKDTKDDAPIRRRRKAPVKWEDDKNEKGETAMSLLLNWITTYDVKNVQGKISELEKQFNEAAQWLGGTGQGVMNGIDEEKAKNNWTDDDPEYLNRKKRLIEDFVINKKCRYYYQVEHVLGTRDKATRLDAANSADPKSAEAYLDCLGLSSREIEPIPLGDIPIPNPPDQNNNEHSQDSNDEYRRQGTKSIISDNDFDISNDDLRRVLDENLAVEEDSQPSQAQSSYKSASVPTSQSRHSHKPGAETQITHLLSQQNSDTQSSISRLEDIFIKSELDNTGIKDVMKEIAVSLKPKYEPKDLLSTEELVEQAKVDAQLKVCQLEAAQLDVQKTRRAMELELAIAKGNFISQFMKDNNIDYKQAKDIAKDLYKSVEQTPKNTS
ncbi:hypothetical protein DFH28DRAFT_1133629 [Melampsora americana]|nr:hypothetical protein DFH28DRAFT_1133629 [Melampsora americana]